MKKIGSVQELRIWRARFAGTDAGTVVVSIEFPDMQAFAEDDKKTAADPEFQTWMKALSKTRTIVSESLFEEVRPGEK